MVDRTPRANYHIILQYIIQLRWIQGVQIKIVYKIEPVSKSPTSNSPMGHANVSGLGSIQVRKSRFEPPQIVRTVDIIAPIPPPKPTRTSWIKHHRFVTEGGITYSKACGAFDHPCKYACALAGRPPYPCSSCIRWGCWVVCTVVAGCVLTGGSEGGNKALNKSA